MTEWEMVVWLTELDTGQKFPSHQQVTNHSQETLILDTSQVYRSQIGTVWCSPVSHLVKGTQGALCCDRRLTLRGWSPGYLISMKERASGWWHLKRTLARGDIKAVWAQCCGAPAMDNRPITLSGCWYHEQMGLSSTLIVPHCGWCCEKNTPQE